MDKLIKAVALFLAYQVAFNQRNAQQAASNNGVFLKDRYGKLAFQQYEVDSTLSIALVTLSLTFLVGMAFLLNRTPVKDSKDNAYEKRLKAIGFDIDSLESGHEYLCPIGLRVMVDPVLIRYSADEQPSNISYERALIDQIDFCPVTRRKIVGLVDNKSLKHKIEAWVSSEEKSRVKSRCPSFTSFFNKKSTAVENAQLDKGTSLNR